MINEVDKDSVVIFDLRSLQTRLFSKKFSCFRGSGVKIERFYTPATLYVLNEIKRLSDLLLILAHASTKAH